MKIKFTQSQLQNISKAALFLCVIAIIVQLFPIESKFKYQFEVGKPWSYELITASFDFPIYKSEQQINKEKEEILKDFTPYYLVNTNEQNVQVNKLFSEWKKKSGGSVRFQNYIQKKFQNIYGKGIISIEEFNKLKNDDREKISELF